MSAYKKLAKKEPRKTAKVVYNEETLKRKSIDELKEIARLRGIKNRGKLKEGGLITSLLKSEISNAECLKYFNTNASNSTDDDTYDGKIRHKISNIRVILSRLRDIVNKNDRMKIKKELYQIEKKENVSEEKKEKIYDNLVELVNKLNKKEKYRYYDRDDLDYHGITDIENVFDNTDDDDDFYKPLLVKSFFNVNYKYYESRGDKDKKLSIE